MEAVGRLAGGVAHDFNNMLGVILGYAEMLKSKLPPGDRLLYDVLEIERAGLRSRDITRQLLAFSRKQIISPRNVELNTLVESML
jgi:signal transduction histidine kinase